MSGHNKWSKIKRGKEAKDKVRGNTFSKLSRLITLAVLEGGGITDPNNNIKLRLAIDKAKHFNMPKENIARAVARASGPDKSQIREVIYEGFASAGVGLIIYATTDNPNRTLSEIRNILERHQGKLGTPGSVSYLFNDVAQSALIKIR
jgi:YebC/PmpR family DNA-binding regulatory protein